jgi:hypothetical protein
MMIMNLLVSGQRSADPEYYKSTVIVIEHQVSLIIQDKFNCFLL